jgi:hypothetical protein
LECFHFRKPSYILVNGGVNFQSFFTNTRGKSVALRAWLEWSLFAPPVNGHDEVLEPSLPFGHLM